MEKSDYNWNKYLALGYTADFFRNEELKWAKEILEYITDDTYIDNCCENLHLLLKYYSHETAFLFLIYYPDSLSRSPHVFSERLTLIKQKYGTDWDQILVEKLYNGESSIFEGIGYLREQDWKEAIDSI